MRMGGFRTVALLGLLVLALAPGVAAAAVQGQDLTEMLASSAATQAVAVSGAIISASPLTVDFGVVDNGTTGTQVLHIFNTGDQPLVVSSMGYSDAAYSSATPGSIAAGGSADVSVHFQPNDGQSHPGQLTISSNATNGALTVLLAGQANAPPTLNPIGDKTVTAFTTLAFTVTATDTNDTVNDELTFSMGAGLPPSATFNASTGAFSWSPTAAEMGLYTVVFSVSDGRLSASETVHFAVTVTNRPPVANAGGPYSGATNRPLQFNGGGSVDPDAGQLTYAWDFGDGATGSGSSPVHTYLIPGNFIAALTVCDDGTPQLCDEDFASVTVQTEIGGQLLLAGGSSTIDVRKKGNRGTAVGLEEVLLPYTDLIPSTLKMSHNGPPGFVTECVADPRVFVYGDMDTDGVTDIDLRFSNQCLAMLFNNVTSGNTYLVTITGSFAGPSGTTPLRIERNLTILAKHRDPAVSSLAYPNPFNPETSISYTVSREGPVTMRIYSVSGRLVRTLKNGEATSAGTHEVRWNGVSDQGRHVPSGIYFVKTSQRVDGTEESAFTKLAITK